MRCDDCKKVIWPWQSWRHGNHTKRRCFHHWTCLIESALNYTSGRVEMTFNKILVLESRMTEPKKIDVVGE